MRAARMDTCWPSTARTHAGRLVAAYGRAVHDPEGTLTHTFPSVPNPSRSVRR
ncbi:hypothetical protein MAHJHV50_50760 [Mycobacterium avium subsp. hominissuis]